MSEPKPARMPSIFVAHGSPYLVDDAAWMSELASWARAMPRPKSILVLSAHWIEDALTIGTAQQLPLYYDFTGFPARYYEMTYAAPGAPELAERVRELVSPRAPVRQDERRALDHGAYVPLMAMYPEADIPVLQLSLPTLDPSANFELGRALAPLRDEGTLILGSGFLTHNMSTLDFTSTSSAPAWALEHDAWCAERLSAGDVDALVNYRARAPEVRMAHPTHEHFVPVLGALGAAASSSEPVQFPITGFIYGSFTRRSVQFG